MSAKVDEIIATCFWCEKPIDYANAAVTITRQIEQFERDETITVIQADDLILLCGACGNRLDTHALSEALAGDAFRLKDPTGGRSQ